MDHIQTDDAWTYSFCHDEDLEEEVDDSVALMREQERKNAMVGMVQSNDAHIFL